MDPYNIENNYEHYYSNGSESDENSETSPETLYSSEITRPNIQTTFSEKEK
ncbi:27894_t:CDS:1, partial [Dentiscutata erythropus]